MRLERHINRLIDTLYARRDVEIEGLTYQIQSDEGHGSITARVAFLDGSLLEFSEHLIVERGWLLNKISYAYHYQRADGALILRYDNTPHHPEITATFPHHKHAGEKIEASVAPDLHDVLQEIDRIRNSKRARN
jgi:hypothetical protein